MDALLTWLDDVAEAFDRDARPAGVAFLVGRVAADVETATEVALCGYTSVALDALRDVLEIEYLLHVFAVTSGQMDRWLTADARTLKREFAPVEARKRLKAAGVGSFGDNAESLSNASLEQARSRRGTPALRARGAAGVFTASRLSRSVDPHDRPEQDHPEGQV